VFESRDQHEEVSEILSTAMLRVNILVVLSTAKAHLPGHLNLHGAPGEALPSIDSRANLIEERLDNRLLDGRVAATAAIFKIFSGVYELAVGFLAMHDFYHIPTPALIGFGFPGEDDDLFSSLTLIERLGWHRLERYTLPWLSLRI
jgi:aspartyl-tRNA synthetase